MREHLRLQMRRNGLSQRGLSRLAALDETAVKQILSGRSRSPRLDTVARLASALNTSVADLIGESAADSSIYSVLTRVFDLLRDHALLSLDEQESRMVAAAIAECLNDAVTDKSTSDPSEHVAAVVRNLVSARKFKESGMDDSGGQSRPD
ncbi:helix-turn-helix domain-containing protein [Marivibrio halodurans]|uniref:Helix-turn-helix domain-containing protein n=1 Tax=Marivibrio halodurans TaxID=2039722 RepID=A0A8J7V204_9PROT|nr:helix-turn-helix transcriptional regulator [Marivibrio halodurans]MBP5856646.1 helix-turn-helix domain-containing protein [Marivibrio halodurans]